MTTTDPTPASMGEPLSEADRLAEIQARLDAATDGPWQDAGDVSGIETASGERITEGDTSGYGCVYISDEDRALIASAPADLTYLLDMAEDRRARVEALKATSRRVQERLTEATARVGVLEGQLATARERHQPVIGGIQIGRSVKQVKVCSSCPATQWPCPDAKALGLDGGGSEAETRTTAPDTAMDEFEAADDIYRRWE